MGHYKYCEVNILSSHYDIIKFKLKPPIKHKYFKVFVEQGHQTDSLRLVFSQVFVDLLSILLKVFSNWPDSENGGITLIKKEERGRGSGSLDAEKPFLCDLIVLPKSPKPHL